MSHKRQKTDCLGMSQDTAERKLRKAVILELAKQLGRDYCAACGQKIESHEDLAVFHLQDWSENPELFWNLTNVAFGHTRCATTVGAKTQKKDTKMHIKVTIEDENNRLLPAAIYNGTLYVGGEKGVRYKIRLRNLTPCRVCCVLTVDGRNVIDGEVASQDGQGYVLAPFGDTIVDGWRRSNQEVAAFRFSSHEDSYSAQGGSPENVGVIGVAVFEEEIQAPKITIVPIGVVPNGFVPRLPWYPWYPAYPIRPIAPIWGDSTHLGNVTYTHCSAALGSAHSAGMKSTMDACDVKVQESQAIGTGYGENMHSAVQTVNFKRKENPSELIVIRYDDVETLRARGILKDGKKTVEPQAFPKGRDVAKGYAAAPARRTLP